ncbi:MAG TPA: (4Fe-4S)-binding protein [Mucilaginibacter sp.]|nr:(4Fe-4S)-binding protein [Mucilaginibacter sp.]
MEDITKKYDNGEITVVWQPRLCAHSGNCVRGLPSVFDNTAKPWINLEGADTDAIIAQVNKCPSGALSYVSNKTT